MEQYDKFQIFLSTLAAVNAIAPPDGESLLDEFRQSLQDEGIHLPRQRLLTGDSFETVKAETPFSRLIHANFAETIQRLKPESQGFIWLTMCGRYESYDLHQGRDLRAFVSMHGEILARKGVKIDEESFMEHVFRHLSPEVRQVIEDKKQVAERGVYSIQDFLSLWDEYVLWDMGFIKARREFTLLEGT